ncbi:MAG: HAMP domain protein [Deltaproteobacteria bacterium ADurb.Bin022]|nr:MAG: HAMP domain protein [Deltaproteobacteria bacterium ADurb.Bin022]
MNFTKRKNYFIEKKFQTKYLLLTLLLLLSYTFVFIVVIFAPYILTLYFDYPLSEKNEAARALLLLHGTVWPWIGGVILFFCMISVFISHKVAGPLFRLKKSLIRVTQGDLDVVIKLRKWDDLKDLAEHINTLIEELRTFVITLRNDYALLSEYILELEREIETKVLTEEKGKEIIRKVQESRKNIEAALKRFNVPQ